MFKDTIKKMTLTQKLAQLSQFNANCISVDADGGITGPALQLNLTMEQVSSAGSVLNIRGVEGIKKLQDDHLKIDPNKIPLLFMQDVIHGCNTIYPIPLGLGATFDDQIVEECCKMAAIEAKYEGIHVIFAPMLDLVRDPRWGRCMESTGEDPYLNGRLGRAMVRGFQQMDGDKYDTVACIKHFAGYGQAEAGRDYNTTDMSEHTLREYYLPAYKQAIDQGAKMVMTSFNALNGIPVTANKWLVNDILRQEWGFDGVVISDYNAFVEMVTHGYCQDHKQCAERAMNASVDVEMMSTCYLKNIPDLVAEGAVSEGQVDEALNRLLTLKYQMGLFENPHGKMDEQKRKEVSLCTKHREIARISAERSAVLLKNDNVLPFSCDVKSVAVIGPFGNDAMLGNWRCYGEEEPSITMLQGVKTLLPNANVQFAMGCGRALDERDTSGIADAVQLAKGCDCVILCVGEGSRMSGEGNSRAELSLSHAQQQLVEQICQANVNVVAVVFSGRPLVLTQLERCSKAIVQGWMPGTEGGNALANLIFGKVNFSGKLPMTFPRSVGQIPIYYNAFRTGRPKVNDDAHAEYVSCYLDVKNAPLYPFGYGLSYSKFTYSNLTLDKDEMTFGESIVATVTITNESDVEGVETAQLYLCDNVASLVRPIKELKGYKQVKIAPRQSVKVSFQITEEMLKFWSANNRFEAENGTFTVWINGNSEVKNSVNFQLK